MLATITALLTVFGGAYGSVWFLDGRYAPLSAVEDLAWSTLKDDIRDLRERIRQAQNPELKRNLEEDLEELLDRFCRSYADDRECRERK